VLKPATIQCGTGVGGKTLSNLVVKFYFPAAPFFRGPTVQPATNSKQNHSVIAITRIAATVQFSRRNLTQKTAITQKILPVAYPKRHYVLYGQPTPIFSGYSGLFPGKMQPGP
jgi:hypothetical protein